MTAGIAMNVPGGRSVAAWWRELAGRRPRRLWFAHFTLHHIEALVERDVFPAHEVLARGLLALLATQDAPLSLQELQSTLYIEPTLAAQLFAQLQTQGLVETSNQGIRLAASGGSGHPPPGSENSRRLRERRVFHFTDGEHSLFVPLSESCCSALMPPSTWSFDLTQLERYLVRPAAWRQENRFAEDVRNVLHPHQLPENAQADAVALDRAEQALLVLIQTDEGLLGFPVRPEDWEMQREPALALPITSDLGQALLQPLGAEHWKQAWLGWCQQRSLPGAECEACHIEVVDHRLQIRAPSRLVDRLRQSRHDGVRGESWLLAGTGRIRHGAQIEMV